MCIFTVIRANTEIFGESETFFLNIQKVKLTDSAWPREHKASPGEESASPRGNMSQVIFRSTPTLYISQGDQATANSMAGVCSLSVGYPRGIHSSHMNGCCLIPLGYVQRGSRSKNNLRHLTNGKGYVWGIWSLPPLFSLGMTYPPDKVIWRLKNWEQDFHSSLSSSSLMLRANKFMLIVKC